MRRAEGRGRAIRNIWWKRPAVGGLIWLFGTAYARYLHSDNSWAEGLLILAALVIVPLGLEATAGIAGPPSPLWSRTRKWLWAAAFALLLAYRFPRGELAAVLFALPWVMVTVSLSLSGLAAAGRNRREPSLLAIHVGYVFIGVGGAWLLADRAGVRPLDFEPVIVLLTAVHFHYAGFVLPLLTGLAARRLPGRVSIPAVFGAITGVPLVASGITATQLGWGIYLEALAAAWLAASGLLAALLQIRLGAAPGSAWGVRILWLISALSLIWSMLLAALYGGRAWISIPWLDIPAMWTLHGTANAFGFALCGLLAWSLEKRGSSRMG